MTEEWNKADRHRPADTMDAITGVIALIGMFLLPVLALILMLVVGGCGSATTPPPDLGLREANDAASRLEENHRSIRWHLEQAREALK